MDAESYYNKTLSMYVMYLYVQIHIQTVCDLLSNWAPLILKL